MSVKQSIIRQKNIEAFKIGLKNELKNGLISDVILLEFPKWSLYYKDGSENHSFHYDCFTNAAIYKLIKIETDLI